MIYPKQAGFWKRHSTETALIEIIDELLDNDRVSVILIDYCKAFDMADHSILIQNLQVHGLDCKSLAWFQSYLDDRRQLVSLGNKESPTVRHGVPKGSILGPLLFITYINDLPLHVVTRAEIDLYADDTTFLTSAAHYDNVDTLQSSLSTAISEVNQWAMANKLPLNETKTKVLTITGNRLLTRIDHDLTIVVNGKQLENVHCAKLLGLEIDQELTFIPHIDKLCKKLSQKLGILKKIRYCLPLKYRLLFYNAMISNSDWTE